MANFKKSVKKFFTKVLISVIIFLVIMILFSANDDVKNFFKENIAESSLSFNKVNSFFSGLFNFKEEKNPETVTVSKKIEYTSLENYKDGVILTVANASPIKALSSGVVVFIGEKDGYKDLIIVQGINGVDIWYGNIKNSNYKLYDYVSKNDVIGETNEDKLIIVMKKENKYLSFDDYQNES